MSQENVETTRRFTERLARGDCEAAARELGPNVEIDDTDNPESTGTVFYAWMARWNDDAGLAEFRDGKIVRIGSAGSLRAHFKKQTGTSPTAYRQAFAFTTSRA